MPEVIIKSPVFAGALGLLQPSPFAVDVPQALADDLVGRGAASRIGQPSGDLVPGEVVLLALGEAVETVLPDEVVRMTATGCVIASPGYISRIRCITGSAVALTVYDNPAASSGTQVYSGTLSAGQEATLSAAQVRLINGARAVFASGSFDFYVGQEAS